MDFGLWTRRIVQFLIQEKFGIELGLTAVGRLLASLEITPQKPLRRAYERDPVAVDLWVKETYPELKKRAKKLGAQIFFLDEATVGKHDGTQILRCRRAVYRPTVSMPDKARQVAAVVDVGM